MSTRPAPATPSPLAATLEARESSLTEMVRGRLMQRSLQTLLDRVEGSRGALRHLAALETALIEHGAGAVPSISARGLTKILAQLRILPLAPDDGPIQDLLALVQRALRQHERPARTHQLSPHDPQSTVVISESSESDFLNAIAEARGGH
ncbi:MAG: hypothetical protein KJ023_00535 [Burkholderiaceae bacterium]|nr:hypothetical protein [Burkholderiaceae bacterium]